MKILHKIILGGGILGFIKILHCENCNAIKAIQNKIRHCEILRSRIVAIHSFYRHCEQIRRICVAIHSFYRHCEILQSRIVAIHHKIRHCEQIRRICVAIHFLILTILSHLNAVELSTLCSGTCDIKTPQSEITNTSLFTTNNQIKIETQIQNFINYGTIKSTANSYAITIDGTGKYITNFYNYGRIETTNQVSFDTTGTSDNNSGYKNIYNYGFISGYIYIASGESGTTHLTNYGEMRGVKQNGSGKPIAIENYGVINLINNGTKAHFEGINLTIKNYAMLLSENTSAFNTFNGINPITNSHLVINGSGSVKFADKNSKLILDFGGDFEFGKGYLFSKLVTDTSGNNKLSVDLSRLTTKSSLYKLTQSRDYFIVSLDAPNSEIGILNKSNVRTMNNFWTLSNSMIYPRKYHKSQNLGRKNSSLRADSQNLRGNPLVLSSLRVSEASVAIQDLNANDTFFYQNESQNLQTRRIQRKNKRNYSRNLNNPSLRADSQNLRGNPQNQRNSQNLAQSDKYYFILTPFVNHNLFFKSGRYNLSGFDYGFLTAFSAKIAESNSLGAHFMMSYGTLGDSSDKNFHISNLNLNLGLNYKLDLVWDMYLKARGDFFYFLNQVKTLTMMEAIKPNNLGFGASVSYGKDFDFKQGGILGIEGGIDYKALQSNKVELHDNTYQKQLYNLLYADLGLSYNKYFGSFGLNANLGIKGNITANKLAKSQIRLNALNRSVDMVLDNDKILGYANVGLSYVLNARNFDMEFSLAYYGNFGDRVISNGGGVEWRVTF